MVINYIDYVHTCGCVVLEDEIRIFQFFPRERMLSDFLTTHK